MSDIDSNGGSDLGHSDNSDGHHHVSHTYKEPNFSIHSEYNSHISSENIFVVENLKRMEMIPKIIGLTGGIGSGKTSVAKYLESKGFPVYYSDDRAKYIVNEDDVLKSNIKTLLGEEAYDSSGLYDRKYVADKVFSNQELLSELNQLIHPAVKIDFENWTKEQQSEFVFKETALLFELELHKSCYKSLLVTAEDNLRIKRVMDRDGKTYRQVENVIQKQMPEKDKIKKADFVIHNNSNLEKLMVETDSFLEKLN